MNQFACLYLLTLELGADFHDDINGVRNLVKIGLRTRSERTKWKMGISNYCTALLEFYVVSSAGGGKVNTWLMAKGQMKLFDMR